MKKSDFSSPWLLVPEIREIVCLWYCCHTCVYACYERMRACYVQLCSKGFFQASSDWLFGRGALSCVHAACSIAQKDRIFPGIVWLANGRGALFLLSPVGQLSQKRSSPLSPEWALRR